jgi:hypothetical protein
MNGKIQQTDGRLYFRVVKNLRIEGKPTNLLIKTVASVPPANLKDNAYRVAVSAKIDAELRKLKAEKKITAADIAKIKGKFAVRLARPKKPSLDESLLTAYPFLRKSS